LSGEFQDISNKTLATKPRIWFQGWQFQSVSESLLPVLIDDFHPRTPLTFPFLSFFVVVEAHRAI